MPRFGNAIYEQKQIPEIAGVDIPIMVQAMAKGEIKDSWAIPLSLATLRLKKVHLLATHGLIRNIGQDHSGIHGGVASMVRSLFLQNRNVVEQIPPNLEWLSNPQLDIFYAAKYREFVQKTRRYRFQPILRRMQVAIQRYILPNPERYCNLDLINNDPKRFRKRALLSYIVHPFSISKDDPRYYRHINIWRAQEIVRILNRMGYLVDVVDYRDEKYSVQHEYDLFIGHGRH